MSLWLRRGLVVGLVAGLPAALSGCAQYSVAGQFEDTGELFFGAAAVSLTDAGTLEIATANGRTTCTGATRVSTRAALTSNSGIHGSANARCNDGRTFKVDFIQTSHSGGHGQGIDDRGNVVRIFFDTSSDAVRARLDKSRLDNLIR